MVIYLHGETKEKEEERLVPLDELTPRQIVGELDKYIVGQKAAKRAVAIALLLMGVGAARPAFAQPQPQAVAQCPELRVQLGEECLVRIAAPGGAVHRLVSGGADAGVGPAELDRQPGDEDGPNTKKNIVYSITMK